MLLYLAFTKRIHEWIAVFKKRLFHLFVVGVFFYAGSYILQYWGIEHTTATNQAMLSNTQTFWLILFNFIILKKKPSKKFIPGAILAFTGVLLIILNDEFRFSPETIKGDIISIVTFIFWGLYSFFVKPLSEAEKPVYITTSIIISGIIVLVPLSIASGAVNEIIQLSGFQWFLMIYLGIFAVGFTFILWATALSNKNLPSENVVLITMLNPVVGVITSILWLDETLTINKVFGIFIVLSAVFIVNYNRNHHKKAEISNAPTK